MLQRSWDLPGSWVLRRLDPDEAVKPYPSHGAGQAGQRCIRGFTARPVSCHTACMPLAVPIEYGVSLFPVHCSVDRGTPDAPTLLQQAVTLMLEAQLMGSGHRLV